MLPFLGRLPNPKSFPKLNQNDVFKPNKILSWHQLTWNYLTLSVVPRTSYVVMSSDCASSTLMSFGKGAVKIYWVHRSVLGKICLKKSLCSLFFSRKNTFLLILFSSKTSLKFSNETHLMYLLYESYAPAKTPVAWLLTFKINFFDKSVLNILFFVKTFRKLLSKKIFAPCWRSYNEIHKSKTYNEIASGHTWISFMSLNVWFLSNWSDVKY